MTIFQLSRMSKAEREAFIAGGGVPTYPASFFVLLVVGLLSAWFLYAIATQPPSQLTIERRAVDDAAYAAEFACMQAVQDRASNPSTFELERTGSKVTEAGHVAEVWFSAANGFGVSYDYSGVCQVEHGKVVKLGVSKR